MLGELYLYDEDDNVVNYKAYYSIEERKRIMDIWEWSKRKTDYIQLFPHKNAKQPPSEYSNIPIYDYNKSKNGHGH